MMRSMKPPLDIHRLSRIAEVVGMNRNGMYRLLARI